MAIVKELVERSSDPKDLAEGFQAFGAKDFEIAWEPNEKFFSVSATTNDSELREEIATNLFGVFFNQSKEIEQKTFRVPSFIDRETDMLTMRADSWEDLIDGVNRAVSDENKIDINILKR